MRRARWTVSALVGALLLALAAPMATAAEPAIAYRIFFDYSADHVIDGEWEVDDLQEALAAARGQGAGYREFQRAVERVLDNRLLGVDTTPVAASPPAGEEQGLGVLPQPTLPGDRDRPPWPFIALSGLAVALVLTGAGSTLYRRLAR